MTAAFLPSDRRSRGRRLLGRRSRGRRLLHRRRGRSRVRSSRLDRLGTRAGAASGGAGGLGLGGLLGQGALALDEHPAEHLADRAARQVGDDLDRARDLVGGEVGAAGLEHARDADRRAGFEHDVGLHRLAAVAVGGADHDGLGDAGDAGQHVFHLRGVDVEAPCDDQLLLTVDDREVAVLVHDDEVAGEHEAVVGEQSGQVFLTPVAGEDLRTAHRELPGLADGHQRVGVVRVQHQALGPGQRQPDRARSAGTDDRVAVRRRRGLGQAVALDQAAAGELLEGLGHFRRQLHRTRHADADRPEVVRGRAGVVQERLVDRRDPREHRRLLALDRLEHLRDVEARDQDQRAAEQQRAVQADGQPVGVEQRQHRQRDLAARGRAGVPEPVHVGVGDQVRVRQHGALGRPGGAARVLQQRQVVHRVDRRLAGRLALEQRRERHRGRTLGQGRGQLRAGGLGPGRRQPQAELLPRRQVVRDRRHDDRGHVGVGLDGGHRVEDPVQAHDDLGPAVGELGAQLGRGVQRVVLDGDRTQAQRREQRDDVLRAVRQHDRDPVARPHAEPGQSGGEAVDGVLELAVGEPGAQERQGRARREAGHGVVQQPGQRHDREVVVLGDPGRVLREPRSVGIGQGGAGHEGTPGRRIRETGAGHARTGQRTHRRPAPILSRGDEQDTGSGRHARCGPPVSRRGWSWTSLRP